MPAADAIFCVRCGARLVGLNEPEPPRAERVLKIKLGKGAPHEYILGKVCNVCNLALESNDVFAWCPCCGNVAHEEHLLEWVRAKKRCPMCSRLLDERSIASGAPRVR